MYSIVLMMALTGSADTPALGHHGCGGCNGCYGGYSCGGCHGGGLFRHGRGGCCGCYGGGYSCCGCYGGYSCYGGCYGGYVSGGCYGGYVSGGCYGGYVSGGCYGGYVSGGCYGGHVMPGATVVPGTPVTPGAKPPEKMPKPTDGKKEDGKKEGEVSAPAPATILVTLPADAKLAIDDYVTASTAEARVFVSPDLAPGKDFTYTLSAEIVRDGRKLTATQHISVRAGQETRVSLNPSQFAAASVVQK